MATNQPNDKMGEPAGAPGAAAAGGNPTTSTKPKDTAPTGAGLNDTTTFSEAEDRLEGFYKTHAGSKGRPEKDVREKSPKKVVSPPPTLHRFALEVWIEVKDYRGDFIPPKPNTISSDFVMDTLNMVYPGCTGAYVTDGGYLIAFYGKKGVPRAGLSAEQAQEACYIISQIPNWMGRPARYSLKPLGLTQAAQVVAGLKKLERERLRVARLELTEQRSMLRLDSNLTATAKPFVPLAASSATATAAQSSPSAAVGAPSGAPTLLQRGLSMPAYPTDDEGFTTDAVAAASGRKKKKPGRRRGGSRSSGSQHGGLETTDVDSDASSMIVTQGGTRRKKGGVSNKVALPDFHGKDESSSDVAGAFRRWVRVITNYRDYYEDHFLMPQVTAALKGEAADKLDWLRFNSPGGELTDLDVLFQRLRSHYCGSLTFRDQRNMVENMRQRANEEATDFLIRVGSAVASLLKDWPTQINRGDAEVLQYEVSLNGVKEGIRHVLNSRVAQDGRLTAEQMYDAVKQHETYVAHQKLNVGDGHVTSRTHDRTSRGASTPQTYKPRYSKTTAFPARAEGGQASPAAQAAEGSDTEGSDSAPVDGGGLYLPDFLCEVSDGDWELNVKLARAMQADERSRKRCFACDSPDHLIRDCPQAKNYRRPPQPGGPHKNKLAPPLVKANVGQTNDSRPGQPQSQTPSLGQ